jgi:hypothetical protein
VPSTKTADAAPRLFSKDRVTVFHHSGSAPIAEARGHKSRYFGNEEIDNPITLPASQKAAATSTDDAASCYVSKRARRDRVRLAGA